MQLKAFFLRLGLGFRLGRGVLAMVQLLQRVKAKGAAGADLNFLQRVMLHGVLQSALGSIRPQIHIKVRTLGGRGKALGVLHALGRSLGTLHIGVCCGAGLRIRLLGLGRRLSGLRRGGFLVGRVCLGRIAAGGFLLFQIGGHIKGAAGARLRRGRRLAGHGRQAAGQVFKGFFLRFMAKQLGIVSGFFLRTGGAAGFELLNIIADELHHIHRGNGKKHHQPHQDDNNHDDIGTGTATDGQQRCTDGHTQHTAGPELALPPGKQHLDGLPGGIPYLKVREDDRRTGQQHRQQQHLANESAHMVTGCQQIGQIQQKRADKICNHAKRAKQPAAQNIPEALPRHQHQRNGQNAKPGQHHAADQVLLLGAALFQPGHPLFAAGG